MPAVRTLAASLLLLTLAVTAAAQSPFTPPPDVAAPPADAARSQTGLASKVLAPGTSAVKPAPTDIVTVHYTGWVASDGRMFDSSIARGNPSTFPLNRVMPGWRECEQ